MKRVLIVEDQKPQRDMLALKVEEMGYAALQAATVAEAVQLLDERIDILLLDLKLPNGHGFDVLRKLSEKRNDVAVVVISGHPEEKRHRDQFPIMTWIDKPYMLRTVEAAIKDAARSVDSLTSLKECTRKFEQIIKR